MSSRRTQDPAPRERPRPGHAEGLLSRLAGGFADRRAQLVLLLRASPGRALAILAIIVLQVATAGIGLLAVGAVVADVADGGSTEDLLVRVAVLTGALVLSPVLDAVSASLTVSLDREVRLHRDAQLVGALLDPATISHIDDGERAAEAAELLDGSRTWKLLGSTTSTVDVITQRANALAPLAILCAWNPWAGLLLVVAQVATSLASTPYLVQFLDDTKGRDPQEARRERYAFRIAGGAEHAREVRLFGLTPWLRPRLARFDRGDRLSTYAVTGGTLTGIAAVACALATIAVIALAIVSAMRGDLPVGTLAVVLTAAVSMSGFGQLGDTQIFFAQAGAFQRRLDRYARSVAEGTTTRPPTEPAHTGPAPVDPSPIAPTPADAGAAGDLRLRGVTFRYPGHERDTLRGIDLHVPAGQSLGVVGANGAGKSTLMALMAGLDRPTTGSIELDGTAVGPAAPGHPEVAVILQDFVRYPLGIADNVLLGRADEEETLRDLLRQAGAQEILDRIDALGSSREPAAAGDGDDPLRSATLASGYAGGTDLSGGQWQRIALARALAALHDGARVLVLDEPTSALDVRAEVSLFRDVLDRTAGTTTLLVSHRLSSVRHADRIIVLEDGRIIEDGSHDELMARGGSYAEMFSTQARRFAEAGADPGAADA